jgi:hypothetical protein
VERKIVMERERSKATKSNFWMPNAGVSRTFGR